MIEVNYLAVLVAAVASMALGFLWYSPMLFGKRWMKLSGHSEESIKADQKKMGMLYGMTTVGSLVMAYVLSHVMALSDAFYDYGMLMTGLTTAFWMWFGFVAPVQLSDMIFGHKKWGLYAINTGYQLASLLLMGVIVGYLG